MDLVTSSGSGLDPHISPAAAEFQIPRVAREAKYQRNRICARWSRGIPEGRQFGFLGEARVNVLELNLELDASHPSGITEAVSRIFSLESLAGALRPHFPVAKARASLRI